MTYTYLKVFCVFLSNSFYSGKVFTFIHKQLQCLIKSYIITFKENTSSSKHATKCKTFQAISSLHYKMFGISPPQDLFSIGKVLSQAMKAHRAGA